MGRPHPQKTNKSKSGQKPRAAALMTQGEALENRVLSAADVASAVVADLPLPESHANVPVQETSTSSLQDLNAIHETYGLTGLGQTVVVIDGGVTYDHYALGGGYGKGHRVVGGWDFAENDADPYEDAPGGMHGTHVTGIIASSDETYPGVAPETDIVSLRVFTDHGAGDFTWIESALTWVHDHKDDFDNPITTVNLSVGTAWNSESVPAWAQLESELADLKNDGIFVSVSAGNAFRTYQTVGLSYPAASPYVVPVASVGASGNLSSFSQRSDRVLAAPGESIMSTAPDYVSSFDGVTDDFLPSSGTSMAAPYVAGASMLVRQAFELSGVTGITQDMIYEHLRQTADEVFDSVTDQTYLRVNLDRALKEALPQDLVGDSTDAATDLGTLQSGQSISGWMNSAVDQDIYTFTSNQTGTLHISADQLPEGTILSHVGGTESGQELTIQVVAGQKYILKVEAGSMPGAFELHTELTVRPTTPNGGTTTTTTGGTKTTTGGQTTTTGTTTGTIQGKQVHVRTTDQVDRIEIHAGHQIGLVVNGERQEFSSDALDAIVLDGASTEDLVVLYGTDGDETVTLREGTATITGDGFNLSVVGAKRVTAESGGGNDTAELHDGVGNDLLIGRKNFSILLRAGGRVDRVNGFANTQVFADAGGRNVAILHDGQGDDFFRFAYDQSTMTYDEGAADSRSVSAIGFDRAIGVSKHGGTDRAEAHGSQQANRFIARKNASYLTGFQESHRAEGFDHVDAYAADGNTAIIYDSASDDQLTLTPESARMTGGYSVNAYGFKDIGAIANAGGTDRVLIRDSAGDDTFISMDGVAIMDGADQRQVVHGFENVVAVSTSGNDQAIFYGSHDHRDEVDVNGVTTRVQNATRDHSAMRFETVRMAGTLAAAPSSIDLLGDQLSVGLSESGSTRFTPLREATTATVVAAADPLICIQRSASLSADQVAIALSMQEMTGEDQVNQNDALEKVAAESPGIRDAALLSADEHSLATVDLFLDSDSLDLDQMAAVWETMDEA